MSEIHELTDKEIKAIDDAISVIKKFSKYIKSVNTDNACLRRNLDESIKAGDVTNAQKVRLRCNESAEHEFGYLYDSIKERCKAACPNEKECPEDKRKKCQIYNDFTLAMWMQDVANGSKIAWDAIFKYARMGMSIQNAKNAALHDFGAFKDMLIPEVKEVILFAKRFNIQ